MNFHQSLCSSGMEQVIENLSYRAGAFRRLGIEIDPATLLTQSERLNLQWTQAQLNEKKLSSADELAEHNRLIIMLHRETGESQVWLQALPLSRLRKMMDAIESRW
ncbi:hypothetical protein GR140_31750 (plasmid) [Pseudomonas putida]|uniref:hypothetical protein n=1 Tax=Pseudomonas putida TaxID=303 RepID=UPI001BB02A63|nr:hypothetical protein [Pseudomonas putida]QUG93318.1 hypothetical protein GR140_31750 [Pseudomonas putida]